MSDLADWLLACLADDAAVAREAAQYVGPGEVIETNLSRTIGDTYTSKRVALWQPAFVLADCEAKRQMVVFAQERSREALDSEPWVAEQFLMRLAMAYADRPGYREEWRP